MELVKDRVTKERAPEWRNAVIQKAFQKGLLLLGCGDSTIRFSPALTISSGKSKSAWRSLKRPSVKWPGKPRTIRVSSTL